MLIPMVCEVLGAVNSMVGIADGPEPPTFDEVGASAPDMPSPLEATEADTKLVTPAKDPLLGSELAMREAKRRLGTAGMNEALAVVNKKTPPSR